MLLLNLPFPLITIGMQLLDLPFSLITMGMYILDLVFLKPIVRVECGILKAEKGPTVDYSAYSFLNICKKQNPDNRKAK